MAALTIRGVGVSPAGVRGLGDPQDAGVAFASTQLFGNVVMRGDTVLAVSVPFLPNQAEVCNMVVPTDTTDPLPPGGTCGATCIHIVDPNAVPFQLRVGDVALLQVQSERRLIVVTGVTNGGAGVRHLTFSIADTLFVYPAASHRWPAPHAQWCGGVAVQRLSVSTWYRNTVQSKMVRFDGSNLNGSRRTSISARVVSTRSRRACGSPMVASARG